MKQNNTESTISYCDHGDIKPSTQHDFHLQNLKSLLPAHGAGYILIVSGHLSVLQSDFLQRGGGSLSGCQQAHLCAQERMVPRAVADILQPGMHGLCQQPPAVLSVVE